MSNQDSDREYGASLLVHIAFHFVSHRWQYLEQVLKGVAEYELDRVLVIVDSNTSDVSKFINALSMPGHCEIRVDVHSTLSHSFDLTWAHRAHMASAVDSFDYCMYLEDDILVPWQTFRSWMHRSGSVSKIGLIHGFLRVERDEWGQTMSSDWRQAVSRPPVFKVDGVKYVRPEAFYQACWVYDKTTMKHFIHTDAWKTGFHYWSSVTRMHRIKDDTNYTREFSAFGMSCAMPGRPRIVLPVDDFGLVPPDAWVWHLPNNYAQGASIELLAVNELVKDGLGAEIKIGIAGRAKEVGRWISYFLYLGEVSKFLRIHLKRIVRKRRVIDTL